MVFVFEDIKFLFSNLYVVGDLVSQIIQLVKFVNLNIDCSIGIICIWLINGLWDDIVFFVFKEYGLIGYLIWIRDGLYFMIMFLLNFIVLRKMKFEIDFSGVLGMYIINIVRYIILVWVEGGLWFLFVVVNQEMEL